MYFINKNTDEESFDQILSIIGPADGVHLS